VRKDQERMEEEREESVSMVRFMLREKDFIENDN
jgi:hypothetical protein